MNKHLRSLSSGLTDREALVALLICVVGLASFCYGLSRI